MHEGSAVEPVPAGECVLRGKKCAAVCLRCEVRAEESADRCQWDRRGRKTGWLQPNIDKENSSRSLSCFLTFPPLKLSHCPCYHLCRFFFLIATKCAINTFSSHICRVSPTCLTGIMSTHPKVIDERAHVCFISILCARTCVHTSRHTQADKLCFGEFNNSAIFIGTTAHTPQISLPNMLL